MDVNDSDSASGLKKDDESNSPEMTDCIMKQQTTSGHIRQDLDDDTSLNKDVIELDSNSGIGDSDAAKNDDVAKHDPGNEVAESDTGNEDSRPDNGTRKDCTDKDINSSVNPYSYITNDEFTSEIYKIEIGNLPRFGINQLKKRLASLGAPPIVKIKMPPKGAYAFVTFRCEEDRKAALKLLDGHKWKGNILCTKKASPIADPLLRKRKLEEEKSGSQRKTSKVEEEDMPADERICKAVTPLWQMPYDEQLKLKQREMVNFVKSLGRTIEKNNIEMYPLIQIQKENNGGLCCKLQQIKASPVLEGYRNKCEFTIGTSPEGKRNTVGFRIGSYRSGVTTVIQPDSCIHVPTNVKTLCQTVQLYLQNVSIRDSFEPETRCGHWKTVTVRTNRCGQLMLVLTILQQQLTQDDVNLEKTQLTRHFENADTKLHSVYLEVQNEGAQNHCQSVNNPLALQHLIGDHYIVEDLLGLKFRISPTAFFQVNTAAAEVLYSCVADWCELQPTTVLLDICCGTGTIGLTLSKKVKKIIGIEMCQEAITDANFNAKQNDIIHAEFHCGKAEDVLPSVLATLHSCPLVAVVDPPRCGLHPDVIRAIRRTADLNHLIYISCNPRGAQQNIIDLTRQSSKRVRGEAFQLLQCLPVDLFPHTNHCELIMLFSRIIT